MRISSVITTTLLLSLLCLHITFAEPTEFIANCETGTFLVCHFFSVTTEVQDPIELCVSEDSLSSYFQFYPTDIQGPCPALDSTPTIACPLECGNFCSLACQNLINTSTTPTQNIDGLDCFDCQGNPGDPGSDVTTTNGIQCWDHNENHGCDLTIEDQNKDGKCSLEDCQTTISNTECMCIEPIKLCCYVPLFGMNPPTSNPFPILGQIRWIAWKDCQKVLQGHAPCQGQTMAITQNSALFALMRTKYGGDGVVSFSMPDFQNMKI